MSEAKLATLGVRVPDVLLPATGVDLARWAVVACDQFTSDTDYWSRVERYVGNSPSTLRLIFPEAHLADPDPAARIADINATMNRYVEEGLFRTLEQTMVLVRRQLAGGTVRWGLVVALDLEHYDWRRGSKTLIRATEGTIEDRIPPRRAIRQEAPLELPHIIVLLSDPHHGVIEPLIDRCDALTPLYDADLMEGGGHVTGWAVRDPRDLATVASALTDLHDGLDPANPLLFAMGDGNHSLATAKSLWEDVKGGLSDEEFEGHPARYCLVELENIYDPGLQFEPIHRVLFGTDQEAFERELARHCVRFEFDQSAPDVATRTVSDQSGPAQHFAYLDQHTAGTYRLTGPSGAIPAATVQQVIDALVDQGACEVDYIHGAKAAVELGRKPGNVAVFLPPLAKDDFFASIRASGALPRKTFSMGHAEDKRYYLEARRIR